MTVIAIAGAAGAGKTTLGFAVAKNLGGCLLDLDSLTEPLLDGLFEAPELPHWNDPSLRERVRPARYAALRAAIADQRDSGVTVVAVAPFTAELQGGAEWRALVEACGGEPAVFTLEADEDVLASHRGERELARDVHALPASPTPPRVPHTALYAGLETAQQVTRIRRALGLTTTLPAASPLYEREFTAGLSDLDGTLLDSTPAVIRSWAQLATEFSFAPDLLAKNHGRPAEALLRDALPEAQVARALARIEDLESEDVNDVRVIPGSAEFFGEMPQRAIVTSGTYRIATSRIRTAGLSAPETVITFDDVMVGKPDPQPYLLAAQRLGVQPEHCVAFEDAPNGIRSAHAAGCAVVAITGTHDAAELAAADLVVDRLDQLTVEPLPAGGFRLVPRG